MRYINKTLLASMIATLSSPVWAIPDAGQLLQQQSVQPYPQPQTPVQIESVTTKPTQLDQQQKILVKQIRIVGNQSITVERLHALVVDAESQSLTLAELQQLAQRITAYYQQQGYPYHRAYLPAQTLANGIVTIAILEAKYDQVTSNNQSRTSQKLIDATLAPLQPGKVIEAQSLQHQIKLLNRLNGVKTRNVISAGQQTGTSNLVVDIQPTALMTGYVGLDNYGNEYTKQARLNAGIALNNALGFGDRFSLDGITSGDLHYGRLGYEATINGQGTRLGASYSDLNYELGKEYKALDAQGTAKQSSLWLSQPVLLTNQSEVLLSLQYDYKQLEDDIQQVDLYRHRDIHVGRIRIDAVQYDEFASGGLNQFGVSTDFGRVDFKNTTAKQDDQDTANTQGDFYSVSANLSRLQNLGDANTQLYTALQAQYSPDNLDSAEQFNAGGPYSVSGYQSSMLTGSSGYYALGELRQSLWSTATNQLIGKLYIDTAEVKRQARTWEGLTGDNRVRISSAGFGFNWYNSKKWQAQAKVGFPIGATPQVVDEKHDAEAWLSVVKHF
jgi:hemolysin activation/secretion protein